MPGEHVTNRRKGTHVEVTANEIDIVLLHISMKALAELRGCITLLGHDEQKVTVGDPERDGRHKRPRTMSKTILHVPLLVESTLYVRTVGSGSKVSMLSKIARSVLPVYARN